MIDTKITHSPRVGWYKHEEDALRTLFSQGLSYRELALRLNRAEGSVRNKVDALTLDPNRSLKIPIETQELIISHLKNGKTVTSIASELKTCRKTVTFLRNKHNLRLKRRVKTLDETQAAYLAGIIDGEGCIMLRHKTSSNCTTVSCSVIMCVSNTHFGLMNHIKSMTGVGSILDAPKKGNRKPQRRWTVNGRDVIHLLEQTKEYMVVKRQQADIVIDIFNKMRVNRTHVYSNEDIDTLSKAVELIHSLNKRGAS